VRNYIEFFAIGVEFFLNNDPHFADSESYIGTDIGVLDGSDGDPLSVGSQIAAALAELQVSDPNWGIGLFFDYVTAENLDGFTPMRYYVTLNKDHLVSIFAAMSSPFSTFFPEMLANGVVTIDSPRKSWSHDE
jgi:hypothetical protein